MPLKLAKLLYQVSSYIVINIMQFPLLWYAVRAFVYMYAGIGAPSVRQEVFNSSMSEEEFFKWLKSRGVSEKDCQTLSGT